MINNNSGWHLWDFSLLKEKILNAVNKDPYSKTFGCCDRLYWGWKFKDFADLTKQYSIYPFSILMDEGNTDEIEIFRGMINFLFRFLNRDGSADQSFPFEKSIGPTVYIISAILLSYDKILEFFKKNEIDLINKSINNSLNFSIRHVEQYGYIANHRALFAYTYLIAYHIFRNNRYYEAYKKEIEGIYSCFQEGWFLEYETADPGYQTQCLYYLTLCFQLTRDDKLKETILWSMEEFIGYFIFPNGSFSGKFSGRATEIIYPYPFMYWQHESALCREIVNFIYFVKEGKALVKWYALDYENCIRLGTNYLISVNHYKKINSNVLTNLLPCHKIIKKKWGKAGLLVISDNHKYMVINFKRGAIFKIVNKRDMSEIEDSGYLIRTSSFKYASSIFDPISSFKQDDTKSFCVKSKFYRVLESYLDVPRMICLRFFSLSLLKIPMVADILKKLIAKILMLKKQKSPFCLNRVIVDKGSVVVIKDAILGVSKLSMPKSYVYSLNGRSIPFHMASAGYHHNSKFQNMNSGDISGIEIKCKLDVYTEIIFNEEKTSILRITK